jgi:hypothetical protein
VDEKSLAKEVNSWSKYAQERESGASHTEARRADGPSRKRVPIVAYYKNQRRIFSNSGDLNEWLSEEDGRL